MLCKKHRNIFVQISRLILVQGGNVSDSEPKPRYKRTHKPEPPVSSQENVQSAAIKIGAPTLANEIPLQDGIPPNREVSPGRVPALDFPSPTQQDTDTPTAEQADPTYLPWDSHRSRRELQDTRIEPWITKSRARSLRNDHGTPEQN